MIDVFSETPITLDQAAKLVPGRGRAGRLHVSTLHRWAGRGCNGIRLETVKIGDVRHTTREAIQRFIARCTGDAPSAPSVSARRKREIEAAERELDTAGVGGRT